MMRDYAEQISNLHRDNRQHRCRRYRPRRLSARYTATDCDGETEQKDGQKDQNFKTLSGQHSNE
jgi:hypothetical protein